MIQLLIVDDNEEICDILANFFEFAPGITVCGVARNGSDAIKKINALLPDIVLLDILMPELDGISVLERLKEKPPQKQPSVIVLSAIGQEPIPNEAFSLGASYYMVKPFDLNALLNRIYKICCEKDNKPASPPCPEDKLQGTIRNMVIELGVPTNILGYRYIIDAIKAMVSNDGKDSLTKCIYEKISQDNGTTIPCVEHAIRNAIEQAHETHNCCYAMFVQSEPDNNKKLTNSKFLTKLAETIKSSL